VNLSDATTLDVSNKLKELLTGRDDVFPARLCANFPKVIERICLFWGEPLVLHQYFTDLLTTDRQSRVGFSPEVYLEIDRLCDFYSTLHPKAQQKDDFWVSLDRRTSN
jgi:hypothetical protein